LWVAQHIGIFVLTETARLPNKVTTNLTQAERDVHMKRLLVAVAVLLVMGCVRAGVFEVDLWNGLLIGQQEVPANTSVAQGGEAGLGIRYNSESNELMINVAYGMFGWSRLEGNYTGSGIYAGEIGENGDLVLDLKPIQVSLNPRYGFFQGTLVLPQAYELTLYQGGLYLNIKSAMYPNGEIRGQLVIPEPGTMALLGLGLGGVFFVRRARA